MPNGRQLKWFTTLRISQALADNSQLNFNLLSDMSATQFAGSTVTRTLMEFWILNDVVANQKVMDWGIVYMDGEAVSAGAFPDVDDEDERVDWLGRGRMVAITDVLNKPDSLVHRTYDLRSQRVNRSELDSLQLILNSDVAGSGGLFVTFIVRVLMRMP